MITTINIRDKNPEGVKYQQEYSAVKKIIKATQLAGNITDSEVNENLRVQLRRLKNLGLDTSELDKLLDLSPTNEGDKTTQNIYSY